MFQGPSSISLDAKGRMLIPAKYRDALSAFKGLFTLTRDPDGCLLFFPRPVWERVREKIVALPRSGQDYKRILIGSASDVEMDSAGRVLISPELRKSAGLSRDVMLLGMGDRFEIWDAARLEKKEADAIASGMPDALRDFSF